MNRLLIIDGSNLLFQMFFGMPARIVNEQGKAIQGTLGFVGALLKIIRRVKPSHILAVFDGQHENGRRILNSEYKANRPDFSAVPEDENPFSQLPDIYKALDYLGIKYAETVSCEADDLIAGYALTYGRHMEIIISSFDSDFFQLITDKVSVLRYRGEKTILCTPDFIKEKYDISPGQYADFKSLVGDTADNIKGAEKVGAKTAALLLHEFGSLENLLYFLEHMESCPDSQTGLLMQRPSVRESLIRNTGRLRINYEIIKLKDAEVLPFGPEELEYCYNGITTNEVLKGIGLR